MVGFAVIVGISVASPDKLLSFVSFLGFLTGFFVSSYSMVVNDRYDIEVDKINNPDRPLASGRISITSANIFGSVLLILGLATAFLIGWINLVIALIFALTAFAYNRWVKRHGIFGNALVSASVAIPYIYGASAVGVFSDILVISLASTSFLAGLGREVVKTISDIEGDHVRHVRSIAITYGSKSAARLTALLFLAAIISSVLPLALKVVGMVYASLVAIPVFIFLYLSLKIIKDYSKTNSIMVKRIALAGMFLGLISFIIGGYYRM
tara:strand:+ start:1568 stop:2368 length:801 start_codon:yes stop_codon:yes gene_type:complete